MASILSVLPGLVLGFIHSRAVSLIISLLLRRSISEGVISPNSPFRLICWPTVNPANIYYYVQKNLNAFYLVKIRFQPIGSAPQLQQKVFKISASNRFETVVGFLRRKLGVRPEDSVVCYINQVFAPGLDEGVGGLFNVS
jgi:Ubiquitin-like autophagy protein Apg12